MATKARKLNQETTPAKGLVKAPYIVPMVFDRIQINDPIHILSDCFKSQAIVSVSVANALKIADGILRSDKFLDCLQALQIIETSARQYARSKINLVQFTIDVISAKRDMDAYACIYRSTSSNVIHLNPLMVSKLAAREHFLRNDQAKLTEFINEASRFVAGRLIHEDVHHLNGELNPHFKANPQDTVSPLKNMNIRGQRLDIGEYGEAAEMFLFGGIAETRAILNQDVFNLDYLVVYTTPFEKSNNRGFIAVSAGDHDLLNYDIDNTPGVFEYQLGSPNNKVVSRQCTWPQARSSTSCDMRQLVDDDEEEDEEDEWPGIARK